MEDLPTISLPALNGKEINEKYMIILGIFWLNFETWTRWWGRPKTRFIYSWIRAYSFVIFYISCGCCFGFFFLSLSVSFLPFLFITFSLLYALLWLIIYYLLNCFLVIIESNWKYYSTSKSASNTFHCSVDGNSWPFRKKKKKTEKACTHNPNSK